jgi:hypothetical protein
MKLILAGRELNRVQDVFEAMVQDIPCRVQRVPYVGLRLPHGPFVDEQRTHEAGNEGGDGDNRNELND